MWLLVISDPRCALLFEVLVIFEVYINYIYIINIYSLRPTKSAILVFFRQISGGMKRLLCPHLFTTCG
jgi:hypothetical protein